MKSIFKSKTFWVNVLGGVGTFTGYLPQTPTTFYIMMAANLILRVLTTGPVSVLGVIADAPAPSEAPKAV
jgi:uncharacterized membrane protein